MVAEVKPPSPQLLDVPVGANLAFTVEFDPNAADPAKQFTFKNTSAPSGPSVPNFIWIDEGTVTISVTLGDGIEFSTERIQWSFPPSGGATSVAPNDSKHLSFEVQKPTHYLAPWAFWLFVDCGNIQAIQSPSIFLARRPATEFNLQYSGADGSFRFLADGTDGTEGSEAGIELANQLVLINIITPLPFTVNLLAISVPSAPSFSATSAMVFSSGAKPTWMSGGVPVGSQLIFGTNSAAKGKGIGIRFGIVRSSGSGDINILSPDPILINATIGDG